VGGPCSLTYSPTYPPAWWAVAGRFWVQVRDHHPATSIAMSCASWLPGEVRSMSDELLSSESRDEVWKSIPIADERRSPAPARTEVRRGGPRQTRGMKRFMNSSWSIFSAPATQLSGALLCSDSHLAWFCAPPPAGIIEPPPFGG
jgi:hypothetical protein